MGLARLGWVKLKIGLSFTGMVSLGSVQFDVRFSKVLLGSDSLG